MPSPAYIAAIVAIMASWLPRIIIHEGLGLSVTVAAWAVAVVVVLLSTFMKRPSTTRFQRTTTRLYWQHFCVLFATAALAAFSMRWSSEPLRAMRVIVAFAIVTAGLIVVPSCCRSVRQVHQLILICVIAGLVNAVFLTVCVVAWNIDSFEWIKSVPSVYGRFFAGFKNPNQAGIALSCTFPLAMAVGMEPKYFSTRIRQMTAVAALVLLMGLIATGSKANILLAAVSLIVMAATVIVQKRNFKQSIRLAIAIPVATVLLCAVFAMLLSVLSPHAFDILYNLVFGDLEDTRTLTHRRIIWHESIQDGLELPWTGVGAGVPITVAGIKENLSHSHNWFVDYFRTLGFPGLVLAVLMVGLLVRLAIQVIKPGQYGGIEFSRFIRVGAALSLINYVLSNMSSDSVGPSTSAFLAITAGLNFTLLVDPYVYYLWDQWKSDSE
jgi:O-antigen ligase